jgi:hypothetical protein
MGETDSESLVAACRLNNSTGGDFMKKVIALILIGLGVAGGAVAGPLPSNAGFNGPTQEEYEAAMIVVRAYLEKERLREAAEEVEANAETAGTEPDVYASPLDADFGESLAALPAPPQPTVNVLGNGRVEAASVAAVTANDVDGALMVGYPDTFNQVQSGRLVFDEQVQVNPTYGLCGFEFVHNGAENSLSLQAGCPGPAYPIATFYRTAPIMFEKSFGIGGTLFNGNGTGSNTGGGLFVLAFQGNNSLTCNAACSNHDMTCEHAVDLTSFTFSTCAATASDIQLQLCTCSN